VRQEDPHPRADPLDGLAMRLRLGRTLTASGTTEAAGQPARRPPRRASCATGDLFQGERTERSRGSRSASPIVFPPFNGAIAESVRSRSAQGQPGLTLMKRRRAVLEPHTLSCHSTSAIDGR
jgi:hypothetical protein